MVLSDYFPGVAVAAGLVGVAVVIERLTGAPALISAICLGAVLSTLWTTSVLAPGIRFVSDGVLKLGIICLGAGLSFSDVHALGATPLLTAGLAVGLCLSLALAVSHFLGRSSGHGLVTGGGVGICGAAAIAALGTGVPRDQSNITEAEIAVCVITVTLLSALCVVFYPQIALWMQLDEVDTGVLLGATIHGVGQAIGAGHAQSVEAGQAATITKLIRVALLVPVVLIACAMRGKGIRDFVANLPLFLLGFVALMAARNFEVLSETVVKVTSLASTIFLLVAMAGLGLRTRVTDLKNTSPGLPLLLTGYSLVLLLAVLVVLSLKRNA